MGLEEEGKVRERANAFVTVSWFVLSRCRRSSFDWSRKETVETYHCPLKLSVRVSQYYRATWVGK